MAQETPTDSTAIPQAAENDDKHGANDDEIDIDKDFAEYEAEVNKLIAAAEENPTDENVQAIFEAMSFIDEIGDLIDNSTSALESRMDALSQPVAFTQFESSVYQVDESLALPSDDNGDEPTGGSAKLEDSDVGAAGAVEESKPTEEDQTSAPQAAPSRSAPAASVVFEEVRVEPLENLQSPAPQNDSTTTPQLGTEDGDQTAPRYQEPKYSYLTPMKPMEPIVRTAIEMTPDKPTNSNETPAPRFKSILIPVIADLNKLHPTNYRVPVTVGTKTFLPILDTGSSLLWVPAKMTTSDKFPDYLPVYEAEKLKRRLDSIPIVYGADTVEYRPAIDTCYIGDVGVEKFRFGGAFGEMFEKLEKNHLFQGILGISPSPPAVIKDGTIVSDRANIIQCLEGKIFRTVCTLIGPKSNPGLVKKAEDEGKNKGRGFLAVGELSRDFFSGEMAWCPNLVRDKWVVELDSVIINGQKMSPRRRTALIDTGTSYVCAPERDFDELSHMLGGTPLADASPFFSVPKEKLTEVAFVLGGRKLPLLEEDLFLGQAGELTKHASKPEEYVSSIVRKPGVSKGEDFMDYWVLGGIFLDNGVTSFAYSPFGAISSVGFADIPETDLEKWEGNPPDPWDTSYGGGYFKR